MTILVTSLMLILLLVVLEGFITLAAIRAFAYGEYFEFAAQVIFFILAALEFIATIILIFQGG